MTAHIKSVMVAPETVFGSIDAATGEPDASALATFKSLECERATLAIIGEPRFNERPDARDGFHFLPPEPDTTIDGSGDHTQLREATLSLTCEARGLGAKVVYATHEASPLGRLLHSGMEMPAAAGGPSDAVGANIGANSYNASIGGGAAHLPGGIIFATRSGIVEPSAITRVVGDVIDHSPALSAGIGSETIRMARNLVCRPRATLGASVALRLDGDGWRSYMVASRWESVELQEQGRRAQLVITVRGWVYDDHSDAAVTAGTNIVEPERADGSVAHRLSTTCVVSDTDIGSTAPAALGRTALDVDEFSAVITNTLSPKGSSDSALGVADMEVTDVVAEVSLTLSTVVTALNDDYRKQIQRSLMLGFGPTGVGNAMALYLPAACLQNDPGVYDLGADHVRQVLTYKQGRWPGDTSTTTPAGTPIRLGLSL